MKAVDARIAFIVDGSGNSTRLALRTATWTSPHGRRDDRQRAPRRPCSAEQTTPLNSARPRFRSFHVRSSSRHLTVSPTHDST